MNFKNFQEFNKKSNFDGGKFLNFVHSYKPSLGQREVPYKTWARSVQPFSRFIFIKIYKIYNLCNVRKL